MQPFRVRIGRTSAQKYIKFSPTVTNHMVPLIITATASVPVWLVHVVKREDSLVPRPAPFSVRVTGKDAGNIHIRRMA